MICSHGHSDLFYFPSLPSSLRPYWLHCSSTWQVKAFTLLLLLSLYTCRLTPSVCHLLRPALTTPLKIAISPPISTHPTSLLYFFHTFVFFVTTSPFPSGERSLCGPLTMITSLPSTFMLRVDPVLGAEKVKEQGNRVAKEWGKSPKEGAAQVSSTSM